MMPAPCVRDAGAEFDGPADQKSDAERHIPDGEVRRQDYGDIDAAADDRRDQAEDDAQEIVAGSDGGRGDDRGRAGWHGIRIVARIRLLLAFRTAPARWG